MTAVLDDATTVRDSQFRAGWRIIAGQELAGALTSIRFIVLLVVVSLAALLSVLQSSEDLRGLASQGISELPSVFLGLFYLSSEQVLSLSFTFYELVGLLGPLFGVAFGFDAINIARADGTLARLVAQPIHRDDVITGKFAAGLTLITIALTTMTVVVTAFGMLRLGAQPDGVQLVRLLVFLVLSILYIGVWLAFGIFCSVVFRQPAAAALVGIAAWLLLAVFPGSIAPLIADRIAAVPADATAEQILSNQRLEQTIERLAPKTVYVEAAQSVLSPLVVTLDVSSPVDVAELLPDTQLDLRQSLLLAWPQIVTLVAIIVVLFGVTFILFMRQEIRA